MRSRGGINFEQKGKRWSAYISVSLDPKQDGILDFTGKPVELSKWIDMPEKSTKNVIGRDKMGFMSNLHLRCMEYAFEDRQDYGLGGAGKLDSFDTIFTSPIKWNLKDNQGNVMEGSTLEHLSKFLFMVILLKRRHVRQHFPCQIQNLLMVNLFFHGNISKIQM